MTLRKFFSKVPPKNEPFRFNEREQPIESQIKFIPRIQRKVFKMKMYVHLLALAGISEYNAPRIPPGK